MLGKNNWRIIIIFITINLFKGWCGIAAVVAANIVIYAYVRMAWYEDRDVVDTNSSDSKSTTSIKKTKQRTD